MGYRGDHLQKQWENGGGEPCSAMSTSGMEPDGSNKWISNSNKLLLIQPICNMLVTNYCSEKGHIFC